MDNNKKQEQHEDTNSNTAHKSTSLGTLVAWNISKALEKIPHIDLKSAIAAAQARLDRDVNVVISQCPEERHLECALLAWQQLGHSDADSLYKFYETKKIERERKASMCANKITDFLKILDIKATSTHNETKHSKASGSTSFSSYSMGPVVKLPVEPKIVMRMENSANVRQTSKKPKSDEKNVMNKIDAVCCLDSGCTERLGTLDAKTSELRTRAAKLAQREAERAELLERAEAAWKNLELGYHRRLTLAEEKEDDISKQIKKLIEERNNYKTVCITLVQQLKERGEAAEKERGKLSELEKTVYDRACVRLRLTEQVAKGEAALAEQHCKGAQVDRDLQFKEEEARRRLRNMEHNLESIRALTHDTERAMRAELGAIKEQLSRVGQQLLAEDTGSGLIKQELEELQQEKMGMVEDLDGCKVMCENRMQGRLDELKNKKQQLNELNDKVVECRCKFPIDATVEVKRTASLAALCHCGPEDKILESCSCTSLRSQLLSNLLADLFGGLFTELGWTGSQMPCQLLKCLEDKHNWDRTSVLKTNLRSFFTRLLIGELEIAIATSIEKYHAKWVGATCADMARVVPDTCQAENVGWQERAMERRAQKLATKLAEQLFQDRADQLAQQAKDIVTRGPPPCECGPQAAVYPCIVKTTQPTLIAGGSKSGEGTSHTWRRTLSDVTQLRLQVENLRKDSIKKADLRMIEETIAKLVERSSVQESLNAFTPNQFKSSKALSPDYSTEKRKTSLINTPKKGNKKVSNTKFQMDKSAKSFNKLKQTFAVNLCLCGTQTGANKKIHIPDTNLVQGMNLGQEQDKNDRKQRTSNVPIPQTSSLKKNKPINTQLSPTQINNEKQIRISDTPIPQTLSLKKGVPINTQLPGTQVNNEYQSRTSNTPIPQTPSVKKGVPINTQMPTTQTNNEHERRRSNTPIPQTPSVKKGVPINTQLPTTQINNEYERRTSNTSIPQTPSAKKTIPINAQLSTKQINNERQNTTSTKTICTKDCICFHKKPSTTSIDKLLETIAKWKNDLTDSSVNQIKNHNMKRHSITSNEKSSKDKDRRISIGGITHDQTIENKMEKSPTNASSKGTSKVYEDHIKTPEAMLKTTESEYIGEINLDKSNDSLCKCDHSAVQCEHPNKYISFKTCCCKESTTHNNNVPEKDDSLLKNKSRSIQGEIPTENGDQNLMKTDIPTDVSVKNNEMLCDCDITLLGVTLANKKTNKTKKSHAYNGSNSDNDYDGDDYGNDCNGRYRSSYNKKNKSGRSRGKYRKSNLDFISSCNAPPTCPCQDNFHEIKACVTGIDIKPKDVFILNIDKGIDVVDTIEGEQKIETCICCNTDDIDETKNLEENTFHLLEEHLKEKLDEFKTTSCKSSCIPPEEEEKLFTTLILKVKQIILDTTNNVSCRCSLKPPVQGSWNRAFSLLQEYLKAKIKRVQCHCTSEEDISPIDNVLDKVGKLIENDFDRLKSICKCNNGDVVHNINDARQNICEEEIPVRDVYKPQSDFYLGKDETVITHGCEKILECCPDSLKSVVMTENISSQVPLNLGMESKSCNVIEKSSVNIQTSEIEKNSAYNECETVVSKSHYDCCCKEYVPAYELKNNELLVNHYMTSHHMKLTQEHDVNIFPKYTINYKSHSYPGLDPKRCTTTETENNKIENMNHETNTCNENLSASKTSHLPYIGYTVDCSCDTNIGACVCMKSVVKENNNKLAEMWQKYSDYNKTLLKNVSYIMKNTSNKPTTVIDEFPEEIQKLPQSNSEHRLKGYEVCEVKLSAHGDEDITLKESRDVIDGVHNAACALTESFHIQTNCLTGKDSLDWCECSSRPMNTSNTDECDKTMLSHVSSDIFEGDVVVDEVAENQLPKNCNCDMVPICHVKMLVENIENKLIQSHCTCDSLVSIVCPIHASKIL